MTPACGPRRFAGAPVSERGPHELRGRAVRGRRGAGGVLRGARPPAAPFESRGPGREKRGGRPAVGEENSCRVGRRRSLEIRIVRWCARVNGVAGWAAGKVGEAFKGRVNGS
jgi:hypothetical protein